MADRNEVEIAETAPAAKREGIRPEIDAMDTAVSADHQALDFKCRPHHLARVDVSTDVLHRHAWNAFQHPSPPSHTTSDVSMEI